MAAVTPFHRLLLPSSINLTAAPGQHIRVRSLKSSVPPHASAPPPRQTTGATAAGPPSVPVQPQTAAPKNVPHSDWPAPLFKIRTPGRWPGTACLVSYGQRGGTTKGVAGKTKKHEKTSYTCSFLAICWRKILLIVYFKTPGLRLRQYIRGYVIDTSFSFFSELG